MFYTYIETQTIEPWLYSIRRCACNKVKTNFSVNRTKLYPYANIHYVESGKMEITYDEKRYYAFAGQYFILPPFKAHSYTVIGDEEVVLKWIEYDGSESEAMTARIVHFNGSVVVTPPDESLGGFISQLEACAQVVSRYAKSKIVYALLVDQLNCMISHCEKDSSNHKNDPLENLIQYIDKHLDQNLKVSDLAQYSGYSTSHMIKIFKKRYDMTPGTYMYHRRIRKAKNLLMSAILYYTKLLYSQ